MTPKAFAVLSSSLRPRADVNYALLAHRVDQALEQANFPLCSIDDLTTSIDYGSSIRATDDSSGLPMIRMNNMQDDGWDLSDLKYVSKESPDLQRHLLAPGDVVVNRTNTKDLVGKAAVWEQQGTWVFASYLLRLSVQPTKVRPVFLASVLNSRLGRLQIDQVSRQIAGMTNINTKELRGLRVPLPTVHRQDQLVKALEAARSRRDDTIAVSTNSLTSVADDALRAIGVDLQPPPATGKYAVSAERLGRSGRLDPGSYDPVRVFVRDALRADGNLFDAVPLGSLVDIISERGPTTQESPYIGLGHVTSSTGQLTARTDESPPANGLRFETGDVLLSRLRPRLNKVWLADRNGTCSTEFRVLRLKANAPVTADYLALALRSRATVAQAAPLASGNTHPRIRDEDITELVVPVPAPEAQGAVVYRARGIVEEALRTRAKALNGWASAKQAFMEALVPEQALD